VGKLTCQLKFAVLLVVVLPFTTIVAFMVFARKFSEYDLSVAVNKLASKFEDTVSLNEDPEAMTYALRV
jgi:hypothetical protein